MTDFERSILDKTKGDEGLSLDDIEELEKSDLDNVDKAAIMAIDVLRSELKDKEKEGLALWRFIRYLTEIEMPLKIVDFTYMLFPGNEKYYANILTPTAFSIIQRQAAAMLEKEKYENEEHKKHLEKVANGQMPYGYSLEMPSIKEENNNE